MKKRKLDKKLILSKDTLKNLDVREAGEAAGGNESGSIQPRFSQCNCPPWTRAESVCLC